MEDAHVLRISIKKVQIGMVSAEEVRNSSGLLLIPKDTAINQNHLFRMKLYQIFSLLIYATEELNLFDDSHIQPQENEILSKDIKFINFVESYSTTSVEIKTQLLNLINDNSSSITNLYDFCDDLLLKLNNTSDLFSYLYFFRPTEIFTYTHSLNVGMICNIFGRWLKFSDQMIKEITIAGILHDIGKINIDIEILNKPGRLTPKEFNIIKAHPLAGFELLKSQEIPYGIKMAVLQHHEKFDGTGYPFGFRKEQIHDFAKIVAIADMYDGMTSDRSYHKRISPFKVIGMFEKEALQVLDPTLLSTFLENIARHYIGHSVILSSGESGKIVFINRKSPSRPLIQVGSKIYNLEFEDSLDVSEVS